MIDSRDELNNLSRSLLQIHKSLLMIQKAQQEGIDRKQLSPHELLQALFSNPDFEWLRTLSALVSRIDEAVDDKTAMHTQILEKILIELRGIFGNSDQYADFKIRLEGALQKDPALRTQVESFRRHISA